MKLKVKVIPSSSKDCIAGWLQETPKVKVKAPPEKSKANKAVINILEKNARFTKRFDHNNPLCQASCLTSCRKVIMINADDDVGITKKLMTL